MRGLAVRANRELDGQLRDARRLLDEARGKTPTATCGQALQLASHETPVEEVNLVRYLSAYLYFVSGDYYDGALIGEFVARRYPGHSGSRQCAKIALACYLRLLGETENDSFARARVMSIAEYMVEKWPGYAESEEALATLIPFMLNDGKLQQARTYYDALPTDSPHRAGAALKTGKAVWAGLLTWQARCGAMGERGKCKSWGSKNSVRETARAASADEARAMLTFGVQNLSESRDLAEPELTALLSLAQADVETGHVDSALAHLEHPTRGPLTIVRKREHAVAEVAGFAEETYKTALRASLASLTVDAGNAEKLEQLQLLLEEVQEQLGGSDEGQRRLTAVYVALARDLEQQLRAATPQARETLSQGF